MCAKTVDTSFEFYEAQEMIDKIFVLFYLSMFLINKRAKNV